MEHNYSFEKLEAWKHAKNLAVDIYKITRKFPKEEKFGLTSQLRRSATSVPSNIAEGSGRMTFKAQSNFYQIAYSSLMELYSHLIIANELELLDLKQELKNKIFTVSRLINGLHKSVNV